MYNIFSSNTLFIFVASFYLLSQCASQDYNGNILESLLSRSPHFDKLEGGVAYSRNKWLMKDKRFADNVAGSWENADRSTELESWTGRWMPEKVETKHRVVSKRLNDTLHGAPMGTKDPNCDDAKTNLAVDWSGSPENYTCLFESKYYTPDPEWDTIIMHESIPKEYHARHECMDKPIHYNSYLPTFGTHRPEWARYGEYTFLPVQRWLHNLEHGAIVMLYHPCTHPVLVNKLRGIVRSCLYRHIITPYNLLSPKRPLAVVSWGWVMTMPDVEKENVESFIKQHALQGPEKLSDNGNYDYMLKQSSEIVSTINDDTLCPTTNPQNHHM